MSLTSAIIQLSDQKYTNYTVYFIKVRSTTGQQWAVKKRYSDFVKLHNSLINSTKCKLPSRIKLPGKLWWKKLTGQLNIENALQSRQRDLQTYLDNILFSSITRHSNEIKVFFEVDENLSKGRPLSNDFVNKLQLKKFEERLNLIVETTENKMLDSSTPTKYIESRYLLERKTSRASILSGFRRDSSASDLGSTSISVSSFASPPRSRGNSLQHHNDNMNELSFSRQSTIHSAASDMSNSFIYSESEKSDNEEDEKDDKVSEELRSTGTYNRDSHRDSNSSSNKRWSITETLRYYVSGSSAKSSVSANSNGYQQYSNSEYVDSTEDEVIYTDLLIRFNHVNFQNISSLCHHSNEDVSKILSSKVIIDKEQETSLNNIANILKQHLSLNLEERFPINEIKTHLPTIEKPKYNPNKFMIHI